MSAAVRLAADAGQDAPAWQLGWVLGRYLHRCGYWQEWADILRTARAAAERAGDQRGQACIHRDLGIALSRLGFFADAHAHLGLALEMYQQLGDHAGAAHTRLSLGQLFELQARPREALSQATQGAARLPGRRAQGRAGQRHYQRGLVSQPSR